MNPINSEYYRVILLYSPNLETEVGSELDLIFNKIWNKEEWEASLLERLAGYNLVDKTIFTSKDFERIYERKLQ